MAKVVLGNITKVCLVRKSLQRPGLGRISAQTMLTLETPLRYEKMGPTFRLSEPIKPEALGP